MLGEKVSLFVKVKSSEKARFGRTTCKVQQSLWHEEACTQAQYPDRILCDYGTPWQKLAERNKAYFQGALSQARRRVLATGTVEVYARAT